MLCQSMRAQEALHIHIQDWSGPLITMSYLYQMFQNKLHDLTKFMKYMYMIYSKTTQRSNKIHTTVSSLVLVTNANIAHFLKQCNSFHISLCKSLFFLSFSSHHHTSLTEQSTNTNNKIA